MLELPYRKVSGDGITDNVASQGLFRLHYHFKFPNYINQLKQFRRLKTQATVIGGKGTPEEGTTASLAGAPISDFLGLSYRPYLNGLYLQKEIKEGV